MKRTPLFLALSGLSLALAAPTLQAQEEQVIEEVIVTGSYIPGTPEDAAVPVDVITSEELNKIGSPDMLEFIKTLNVSSGVLGSSNQFDGKAQGSDGAGSVNLRGLGQERTLVLLNGRRIANNPFTGSVDTNLLPMAALGRLEILKDGAAVLYGSDAVGGVVNFITKKDFEGFELGYEHNFIQDSDGDNSVKAAFGWVGDDSNVLVAAGWQDRNKLSTADRDWTRMSFAENPYGGWSGGGNPSGFLSFLVPTPVGGTSPLQNPAGHFADPGCTDLGSVPLSEPFTAPDFGTIPRCRFEYAPFDNLVDPQERYQLYSEYNLTFGDGLEWHLEGLYSHTETEFFTSPSYLATQSPTLTNSIYLVPETHPGMVDFVNQYAGDPIQLRTDGTGTATGSLGSLIIPGLTPLAQYPLTFRPYALGGNPAYDYDAAQTAREYDQWRISTTLKGSIADSIDWDVGLTYSEVEAYRLGSDTVVDRYQAALMGLGGPNCTSVLDAYDNSAGCLTYSPFSTSVRGNALTGQANPNFVDAYDNENPELINWMYAEHWLQETNTNLTVDAVLNGDTGIELDGGDVRWAAGLQYRENTFERELDELNNLDKYPCPAAVETVLTGVVTAPFTTCNAAGQSAGTGPFFFLGGAYEQDLDGDVYAAFGELSIPILENLEMQLAARFEDYGGATGDTFDPKIALRWQATDWMAVRGSYSSTFRAPALTTISTGRVTSLQNINSTFRPIDTYSNPGLEPETADSYNLGVIVTQGNLYASLDYWRFDFDNPLVVEPLNPMVEALFGDLGTSVDDNCGDPAYAGLEGRFDFGTQTCDIANIARVDVNWVNGSSRETDGFDWRLEYFWDLANGDTLTAGTNGTYTLSYEFDDVTVEGILVERSRDAVGALNAQTSAYPLPELKGDVFLNYARGNANFRFITRYTDSYEDIRFTNVDVDQHTTYDFHFRYLLNMQAAETAINFTVDNLTDEDPPMAYLDLDYDPFTHNPLGRTIKLGITTNF